MAAENSLPNLILPKRFEILEKNAREAGIDPREIVERVDSAAARVDALLRTVRSTGCGQLELFLGLSGSGKTTFVSTLPKFFEDISVHEFVKTSKLTSLGDFVSRSARDGKPNRVVLISGRDNPKQADLSAARDAFDSLREAFRSEGGAAVVLWPITAAADAERLASIAWEVGRDSVVDNSSKGIYHFAGLSQSRFYDVADITARNFSGDGLEAFGVTREEAATLLPDCDTITAFFTGVEAKASEVRGETWSVLKERVRPKVWIVLPGDVPAAIDGTVTGLTQGTKNRIDIDLIAEFIDSPSQTANYIADWRKRRSRLAHLLRAIDLRLFGLPPNVALAAVRAFGSTEVKNTLKQGSINLSAAKTAMKRSRLYKAILTEAGLEAEPFAGGGAISPETQNEYRRIQAEVSSGRDKALNKALALLIEACLKDDKVDCKVIAERQSLPGSNLKPDVQIQLDDATFICIEPTWRSTDAGVPGELPGGQNTLAIAHIKKYVLDKASEYVKDLSI